MQLVIVESPAKAKTIEKFLGKDFKVASSIGHIRNLAKSGKDKMGIDIENQFTPHYEIDQDKVKVVNQLKKELRNAQKVWLATDEDREGESIAWHLAEVLNLKNKPTYRITFNEITKTAIQNAIKKPKQINQNLVKAQQTRQIIDKLVGFKVSPILWKKISGAKSAGRVQSPAMKLVVEREREINNFEPQKKLQIELLLASPNHQAWFKNQSNYTTDQQSTTLLNNLLTDNFQISSCQQSPISRNPSAPFTTSTLQQEASNRLGFSVKKTMKIAQDLYREGHISYMRTDSTSLSVEAINQAQQTIAQIFGKENIQTRQYKSQSKMAQEAHEAIRPTNFAQKQCNTISNDAAKLYQLIWQRSIASQMKAATGIKIQAIALAQQNKIEFKADSEIITNPGFLKVYQSDEKLAQEKTKIFDFKLGQKLNLIDLKASENLSKPKSRYSEASLVKKLETLGIGRPSTYATMISTIQDRGYVSKGEKVGQSHQVSTWYLSEDKKLAQKHITQSIGADKNKLYPNDIAYILCDFLDNNFAALVNYDFTAKLEDEFDLIANGKKQYLNTLNDFYQKFCVDLAAAEKLDRAQINQEKFLGTDPKTGKKVSLRMGRFGPFAQLKGDDENEKPIFASLRGNLSLQNTTLEQALELFKLPRIVGKTEDGDEIKANHGRFGAYLQYQNKFVPLKEIDPLKVDEPTARQLIAEKIKKDAENQIKTFANSEIKILNGRFGPYITNGKKRGKGQVNVTLKKLFADIDPKDLSLEQCQKALAEKSKNPYRKFGKK